MKKLLIVEDEEELREVLQLNLEKLKLSIDTAENGQIALEKVLSNSFDAILCDLSMPVMDGLEFMARLRAQGVETPVIVLTAHDNKENMLRALHLGAFDFVEKPYDPVEIVTKVAKAVALGGHLRDLNQKISELSQNQLKSDDLEKKKDLVLGERESRKTQVPR